MTTDTPVTPEVTSPTAVEPGVDFPTQLTRLAHLMAFEAMVKDAVITERARVQAEMLGLHAQLRTKSFEAADLVTGDVLASFTLRGAEAKFVIDNAEEFLNWVLANFPTEIKVETSVNDAFAKALLKRLAAEGDLVIDTETGLEVQGIRWQPAGAMNSFGISWKDGGKVRAAANLFAEPETIPALLAGTEG